MRRASRTRPGLLLAVALLLALGPAPARAASSLRFFGHGTGDIDRVVIRIDGPARPADVGAGDFTLEWWMDYSPSATYTFTPGPGDVGTHEVAVWARNAGSTATVEAGLIAAPFTIGP